MTYFEENAPWMMRKLMQDFDLDMVEAAAILGNLGHESAGFKAMQEKKPLVPGSRGGWGIAQWTGPRRVAAEAYWRKHNLDPMKLENQYKWLFVELKGDEKAAIAAVKRPGNLSQKVVWFENAFERSGVKHYDSRQTWAEKALAAYRKAKHPIAPSNTPEPTKPPSEAPSGDSVHPPITTPPPIGDQTKRPGTYITVGASAGALLLFLINWLIERVF